MKREQAVLRARSAIGHGCIYKLGHGGRNPLKAVPWDEDMTCDCSGFVLWALGLHRMVWLDTTRMYDLAKGERLFREMKWTEARPGDLLVYPDFTNTAAHRSEGHVGIVVDLDPNLRVVHCSYGSWQRESDAICESGSDLWQTRGIVARPAILED